MISSDILKDMTKSLSQREKIFLSGGAFILLAVVCCFGVFSPVITRIRQQENIIKRKQEDLAEITRLKRKYDSLSKEVKKIENKLSNDRFSMLSYLEDQTKKIGIRDNITYMRPKGEQTSEDYIISSVELRLTSITLKQAVELVSVIENAPLYTKVKMFHAKTRFSDKSKMDVSLRASSFRLSNSKNIPSGQTS